MYSKITPMKKITFLSYFLLLGISLNILFTSCKKKTDDPEPEGGNPSVEEGPKGRLFFHLHNYASSSTVIHVYGAVYESDEGRRMSTSLNQLYLSNIQLIRLDGSIYTVPNTVILVKQYTELYTVGDVPAGNYKTVKFTIGLDPSTNQKSPTSGTNDPLDGPEMWFGAQAQPEGYVFVNVQGEIDTTTDPGGSQAPLQPFKYRIGTNAQLKQKTMPNQNFTVQPDGAETVHMYINYSHIFNGIQLNNPSNLTITSVADNASSLATKLANNIPNMFFYE